MIDTKELRRLAQAAISKMNALDPEFVSSVTPLAVLELLDRLEAAEQTAQDYLRIDGEKARIAQRLEAAEKAVTEAYQRGYATGREEVAAELEFAKQEIANLHDDISEWMDKCDTLRAKIEAMEKQEPVAWRTYDGEGGYDYRSYEGNENYKLGWDARHPDHIGWVEPLYALPGAQNVPTSLLVVIADLVTQMEIIARVGFVDTPDDKDSCAAFCVAEGAWLELMRAVKALASAIAAAAPEAKP